SVVEVGLCPSFFEVASDAVEYSVNELHRFRTGELAGDLDGFVDDHRARSLWVAQKFRDRAAQDVAVDGGHALHAPMLRMTLDQLIDVAGAIRVGSKEINGATANIFSYCLAFRPERAAHIIGPLSAH